MYKLLDNRVFTSSYDTHTMVLKMIFLKANRHWYSYGQICKEAKQSISHRSGVSKGKIMSYLMYCCKEQHKLE